MAASLHHARLALAAAINAGFRESGLQSLKNLEDSNSFPMVAVRTSGLALSSLIGFVKDGSAEDDVQCMVEESYLEILLKLANDRFQANTARINRFREHLREHQRRPGMLWEAQTNRKQRNEAVGLERQHKLRADGLATDAGMASINESIAGTFLFDDGLHFFP
jgi:tRNA wybutosine-synthesizing protein 3